MAVVERPPRVSTMANPGRPVAGSMAAAGSTWSTRARGGASSRRRRSEGVELVPRAFGFDRDAGAVVAHPAGQPQLVREPVDEGPEAHALHDAAHLDLPAHAGFDGGQRVHRGWSSVPPGSRLRQAPAAERRLRARPRAGAAPPRWRRACRARRAHAAFQPVPARPRSPRRWWPRRASPRCRAARGAHSRWRRRRRSPRRAAGRSC